MSKRFGKYTSRLKRKVKPDVDQTEVDKIKENNATTVSRLPEVGSPNTEDTEKGPTTRKK